MQSSQPSLSGPILKNEVNSIGEGLFGFVLVRCHCPIFSLLNIFEDVDRFFLACARTYVATCH